MSKTGFITAFVRRHTSHATPVVVASLVFVVSPMVVTLDSETEALSRVNDPTPYQVRRPWFKTAIVGLGALGALCSNAIADRRRRLDEKARIAAGKTEEEWAREQSKT